METPKHLSTLPSFNRFKEDCTDQFYGRGRQGKYIIYYGRAENVNGYFFKIYPFAGLIEEGDYPQANKEKSLKQSYKILKSYLNGECEDCGENFFDCEFGMIKIGFGKLSLSYR